jgi:hypothetical protein
VRELERETGFEPATSTSDIEEAGREQRKLLRAVLEFGGYIGANAAWIPNYGERHRNGEAISDAFVGVDREPGHQQADGEEAAGALDASRCPSAAPDPHSRAQR